MSISVLSAVADTVFYLSFEGQAAEEIFDRTPSQEVQEATESKEISSTIRKTTRGYSCAKVSYPDKTSKTVCTFGGRNHFNWYMSRDPKISIEREMDVAIQWDEESDRFPGLLSKDGAVRYFSEKYTTGSILIGGDPIEMTRHNLKVSIPSPRFKITEIGFKGPKADRFFRELDIQPHRISKEDFKRSYLKFAIVYALEKKIPPFDCVHYESKHSNRPVSSCFFTPLDESMSIAFIQDHRENAVGLKFGIFNYLFSID